MVLFKESKYFQLFDYYVLNELEIYKFQIQEKPIWSKHLGEYTVLHSMDNKSLNLNIGFSDIYPRSVCFAVL